MSLHHLVKSFDRKRDAVPGSLSKHLDPLQITGHHIRQDDAIGIPETDLLAVAPTALHTGGERAIPYLNPLRPLIRRQRFYVCRKLGVIGATVGHQYPPTYAPKHQYSTRTLLLSSGGGVTDSLLDQGRTDRRLQQSPPNRFGIVQVTRPIIPAPQQARKGSLHTVGDVINE